MKIFRADEVPINTIVITPSIVPGRVALRVYDSGKYVTGRLADGDCLHVAETVYKLLREMGLEEK